MTTSTRSRRVRLTLRYGASVSSNVVMRDHHTSCLRLGNLTHDVLADLPCGAVMPVYIVNFADYQPLSMPESALRAVPVATSHSTSKQDPDPPNTPPAAVVVHDSGCNTRRITRPPTDHRAMYRVGAVRRLVTP